MEDKIAKSVLDLTHSCANDDEINRLLFNLSDDTNLKTNRIQLNRDSNLLRKSISQNSTPHDYNTLYSSPNSSPIPQPLGQQALNQHNHTSLGFPLRYNILRTISSSNAASLNSNESSFGISSGISSSSSNYSLVKKSSSSSIYSSSNNLMSRNLSSPSEYCDSSGNEADYRREIKNKRLSTHLLMGCKSATDATQTPDVAKLNSDSRRQSMGSTKHTCSCASKTLHKISTKNTNRPILNTNLKRIFKQYNKQSPTPSCSSASSTTSCTLKSKKDFNKEEFESSCLLRIKSNKLGSSTPNLAFGICSLDSKQQNYSSICSHLYYSNVDDKNSQQLALKSQSKSCKYCMKTMYSCHSSASLFQPSTSNQFSTISPRTQINLCSPSGIKQQANDFSPSVTYKANKRIDKIIIDSESRRWSLYESFPNNNNNNSISSEGYESLPPNFQSETQSDGIFLVPPPPPPPPYDNRGRIYSSSNESTGLLDDSLNNDCCSIKTDLKSPITNVNNQYLVKQRSTRSCSPLSTSYKYNTESDMILLQNEKFKEKFPKACKEMEKNLIDFIETNKNIKKIPYFHEPYEPAARFIHNQIIELANWCLEKSKQNQLTCAYFDEMTNSLEKLLVEASEKCVNVDSSVDSLRKFVKKFLLIVSRVARLLECLEFDPEEFCHLLNAAEAQARNIINYNDIPKYIIAKLGLSLSDPFKAFEASVDAESDNRTKFNQIENISNNLSNAYNSLPTSNSLMTMKNSPKEEDFEKIKLISNGAYGAVHLVRYKHKDSNSFVSNDINDDFINKRFAMKEIKKHNLMLRNQLQQVFTERDIMIFTDNPFVVALICTFETKKHLCMVMEYVEGGDVATLIKNMGPLPLDMARAYFAETTLAVEYLHSYGIIHRDLKPDNLLITSLGHIKLTDFGLSKVGLMNLTTNFYEGNYMKDHYCKEFNDKQICGTPQYLAPEVILRQSYGKTVDWWSMGIILYEFLTSIAPFNGNTPEELFDNVINGEIEWPAEDDELKVSDDAVDLINGLLTHDPMHRLGADGVLEIKKHLFFLNLDWDSLLRTKAKFIPELDGPDDTSYFDTRSDRYNHEDNEDNDEDDDLVLEKSLIKFQQNLTPRVNKFKNRSMTTPADMPNTSLDFSQNSLMNNYDTDTDNELFASFSSCSSKFRICSNNNSNSNSPILQTGDYKQQHLLIEQLNLIEPIKFCLTSLINDETNEISVKEPVNKAEEDEEQKSIDLMKNLTIDTETTNEPIAAAETKTQTVEKDKKVLRCETSPKCIPTGFKSKESNPVPFNRVNNERKESKQSPNFSTHTTPNQATSIQSNSSSNNRKLTSKNRPTEQQVPRIKNQSSLNESSTKSLNSQRIFPKEHKEDISPCSNLSSSPTYSKLNTSNPVVLRQSRLLQNQRPRSMIITNSNNQFANNFKPKPRQYQNNSYNIHTYGNNSRITAKQYNDSAIDQMVNLAHKKPELTIQRGIRGFGFTLSTIQVYYDDTDFYTIQHIIVQIEDNGPAALAGLKTNHLITHVNDKIVCGITHNELIHLILGSNPIKLKIVNIKDTNIKTNGRKRSPSKIKYAHPPKWTKPYQNYQDNANNRLNYQDCLLTRSNYYNHHPGRAHLPGHAPDFITPPYFVERRKKSTLLRKVSEKSVQQNYTDRQSYHPNPISTSSASSSSSSLNNSMRQSSRPNSLAISNTAIPMLDLLVNSKWAETINENVISQQNKKPDHYHASSSACNSTSNLLSLTVMRSNERMHSKLNNRPQSAVLMSSTSLVNTNAKKEQPIQEQLQPAQTKPTSSKTSNSFFTRIKNKLHTNKNQNQQQLQQNPSPLATCDGHGISVSCGKTQKFTPSK